MRPLKDHNEGLEINKKRQNRGLIEKEIQHTNIRNPKKPSLNKLSHRWVNITEIEYISISKMLQYWRLDAHAVTVSV